MDAHAYNSPPALIRRTMDFLLQNPEAVKEAARDYLVVKESLAPDAAIKIAAALHAQLKAQVKNPCDGTPCFGPFLIAGRVDPQWVTEFKVEWQSGYSIVRFQTGIGDDDEIFVRPDITIEEQQLLEVFNPA